MVIPLEKRWADSYKIHKKSEKEFEKEEFGAYKFVPMLINTNQ